MKALPVSDPKAAALDVGSETLHVSLAGDPPHVLGAFTGELDGLREQDVRSVASEATGVYWLHRAVCHLRRVLQRCLDCGGRAQ